SVESGWLPEDAQDAVEKIRESRQWTASVEEPGNRAQEVPEKVAWTLLSRDIEDHPVEVDHQPEQVQIERPESQVQDLAGARQRDGEGQRLGHRLRRAGHEIGQRPGQGPDGDELAVLNGK